MLKQLFLSSLQYSILNKYVSEFNFIYKVVHFFDQIKSENILNLLLPEGAGS